jgi:hypothetical protein
MESIVEQTVENNPHMETVQIVLDKELLQAADRAALRTKRNRSALVRDALREHLRRLEVHALERFSNSRGVTNVVQGGFFLRKKPLEVSGFALHQLENRYRGTRP